MKKIEGSAHKTTHFFIILLFFVFPLFTGPDGYVHITESKYAFLTGISSLWLAALAVCGISALCRGQRPRFAASPVSVAVAAFMLMACVSAIFSPFGLSDVLIGAGRFDGLLTLLFCGAIFLGVSAFSGPREIYSAAFALSVSLCCVVAILQLWGLNPLWLYPGDYTYYDAHTLYTGEFLGTIGNSNLLSGLLSLAVPFFASLFVRGEKHSALYLIPTALGTYTLAASRVAGGAAALIAAAVISAPVLVTDARRASRFMAALTAAAVPASLALSFRADYAGRLLSVSFSPGTAPLFLLGAGLVALSVSVILRIKSPDFRPERLKKLLFLSIPLGGLALLAFIYFFPFSEGGTLYELHSILHGNIDPGFGSSRIRIWTEALALFPERPILGGGPGTTALRLNIEFSRYVPETGKTLRTFVDNAHNDFIDHLISLGAAGLLAYLAGIAATLRLWFSHTAGPMTQALGTGLIGYWIQSFFGLNLFIVSPFMWLIWGIFASATIKKPVESN